MYVPDYGSQRIQIYRKDVIRLGPGEIAPTTQVPFPLHAVLDSGKWAAVLRQVVLTDRTAQKGRV